MSKLKQKGRMLSLIIPTYNSAKVLNGQLSALIQYFEGKNIQHEIIVVDDGSTDENLTQNICKKFNCIYLKNEKNEGKGASVKKGMLHAKGNFRIFTDVDIPFQYNSFETFLNELQNFDIAIGDRTLQESVYFSEIPYLRKISSIFFSFLVETFIIKGFPDTQCGMKGFKSEIAIELFSNSKINGYAFDIELIYIAKRKNFSIKKVPVMLRNQEGSQVNIFKNSAKMIIDLWRIKWIHK